MLAFFSHDRLASQYEDQSLDVARAIACTPPPSRRDRPDPRVRDVFRSADSTPTLATVGERIVVVSARHVSRAAETWEPFSGRRDRTDVESLTRQLDAVQLMSTGLRRGRVHRRQVDEAGLRNTGGRGIGMALSRQITRALDGDIRLSSAGNPDAELCGAEFIARLPGVVVEEEAQWAAQN